ncbi:hypothetical protein [Enterocloster phage PMBT24]|uniref:Uncharacterized protein n=1 Tax=Enterocloster phage PMBT24 TaxID=3025413 RepID=A0AAT9TRA2_9CAUD|nr:hypothetical protein [Enterocloster phage PMBT24]
MDGYKFVGASTDDVETGFSIRKVKSHWHDY